MAFGTAFLLFFIAFPWLFSLPATAADGPQPAGREAVVLMYHHISPRPAGKYVITPELFARHLDMLEKEGYRVVSLEQLADFLEGRTLLPGNAVAITFDDGYESFYTYAYPELKKRKMPAANFLVVGTIGKPSPGIPKLNWAQVKEMNAHGIGFYPHSYQSHYEAPLYPSGRRYSCLIGRIWLEKERRWETKTEYEQRVRKDLVLARETMERELGKPVTHFAWPYGQSTAASLKIARSAGFKYFYYVNRGGFDTQPGCYSILRIDAGDMHVTPQALKRSIKRFIFLQQTKQAAFGLSLVDPVVGEALLLALNKKGV
ncbi:MAG: polysaccharide deacetylase family protein [Firmicutes bacterium]|nr:polysaccharide deacetylase family protein [Bacillota bacterium]